MTEEEFIDSPRKGLVNIRYSYVLAQGSPGYLPLPQELARLRLDDFVQKYTSNFPGGTQCADNFVTKKELAAQAKKPNPRKKPKAKADFETQITFYVLFEGEQLQIKVFTRRSIHVPELPSDDFGMAERAVSRLIDYFNECFAGCDFYSPVALGPGNVMLCNYSGRIKVPKRHTINFAALASMVSTEVLGDSYCYTQYSRGDIKLKLFFKNPTEKKPYKTTSIPIQLRGKIVVMGDNSRERIFDNYYRVARLIFHNRLLLFWPSH